jgi:hypothetical protein
MAAPGLAIWLKKRQIMGVSIEKMERHFVTAQSSFGRCYFLSFPRLLRSLRYANLDFCAVVRAERWCARAFCRRPGWIPVEVSWRSSAGRASDL